MDVFFELQKKIDEISRQYKEGITIYAYCENKTHIAELNGNTIDNPIEIGCIAKVLTSSLAGLFLHDDANFLDTKISKYLNKHCVNECKELLGDISLGECLNHTSGLDHSNLTSLPLNKFAEINTSSFLKPLLSGGEFLKSGTFCDYSNIGPWLVAAALEETYKVPYYEILNEFLLQPLYINSNFNKPFLKICPSTGADLTLSTQDLMKIVLFHMHGHPMFSQSKLKLNLLRTKYPFKILTGLMKGLTIYPAWFHYGNSFGYVGHGKGSSVSIRFQPELDVAVIVTAKNPNLANLILMKVFDNVFVDTRGGAAINLLSSIDWRSADKKPYEGTFINNKYQLHIDIAQNGSLRSKVFSRNTQRNVSTSYYRPLENNMFIPIVPEQEVCPMLQFSNLERNGLYNCISSSNYVFLREKNDN